MKKILLSISCVLFIFFCQAQNRQYNNEWIDYSKTYYKFKVGAFGYDIVGAPIKKGVVRITQFVLSTAGLASVPAEQFQLWKDGAEVPIYTSIPSGVFSSSDFIEFVGEISTGKIDKPLYADSSYQLSDYWNLSTDTGTYFITVNTAGNNLRYANAPNNVNGTLLQPEKTFTSTAARYFRFGISEGIGYFVEDVNLYQSAYSRGEGWMSRPVRKNGSYLGGNELPQNFPNLRLDTTGANMTARINMIGNASYFRNVRILLNKDTLAEFPFDYNMSVKLVLDNLVPNTIKNDTAQFVIQNLTDADEDEIRVASIELDYPRFFNFNAANFFEFSLAASDTGRYIKIYNFNNAGSDVELYDATNRKRYIANRDIPDTLRFLLEPSSKDYKLLLMKSDGSTAKQIALLEKRNFINYADAANQGDYVIVSNPVLYGGTNYVQQYADYRSSDSGGHYNAKVVNVNELVDQFAFGSNMHPLSVKNFLQYARDKFTIAPAHVFIIGKGVSYSSYRANYSPVFNDKINLVPVYGSPGSDNLLSSKDYEDMPATSIGRLSAVTPDEVRVYLEKVKEYERAQRDTIQTIDEKKWMKQVLQLAGANDPYVSVKIDTFLQRYKYIFDDTSFGGFVNTYSKTADPSGYAASL
ncbi:MAG TPA: C25 family cysteine peptidase, partial [Chitinophagaceae bacterium]|nr:C25 family cysteine peptidase [Chitinophagaceae bacterium]